MQEVGTKKSLGQHWLRDQGILGAIADAAELQSTDVVLEIGPGLGTLTEVLAAKSRRVVALEFDQDLISSLKNRFQSSATENGSTVEIVQGDVRTYNFSKLPAGYKVVANIPYYLTSHLIRSLSETTNPPTVVVLLIQKEVAERVCAEPGQLSILGITSQFYFECSLGVEVPAKYFTPPPKVDSQVVVMKRRINKLFDVNEKDFFRVVKAGFSEKRKTLRNSLSGGLQIEKLQVEVYLQKAQINQTARAQELSLQQWYELYRLM